MRQLAPSAGRRIRNRRTASELLTKRLPLHGVEKVIGALLKAECAAKHSRLINYQMGIAKLLLAKELADLALDGTPINAALIERLSPERSYRRRPLALAL